MKLTMLGTGNALATACYNTCFLLEDNRQLFLVDGGGGNGILRQIKTAGYDWMNIRHIFVTHKHIDHFLGILWMVRMICQFIESGDYDGEAYIYSHKEVLDLIRHTGQKLIREKDAVHIDERLHLVEVMDGETREIIGHEITFFDIRSPKAKQFGFRMDIGSGKSLTCCGDEPMSEAVARYAETGEWLMHEAFCLDSQAELFDPYEKSHSTVKDTCELAERLGVRNLILYHTEDKNLPHRKEMYKEEGEKFFHGNLWIPNDLETIDLEGRQ